MKLIHSSSSPSFQKMKPVTVLCVPIPDAGEDWGQEALTEGGFQDYCKIDAHTDKGLAHIAVYNKYIDDWNTVSKTFTDDTPMVAKIWEAVCV